MPLPPKALERLEDTYGPIVMQFTLTQTPQGAAPVNIKDQWIGVALPVRIGNIGHLAVRYLDLLSGEYKENDNPISIAGIEAVSALSDAGKPEATQFWAPYQLGLFTFRLYEGNLTAA